MKKGNAIALLPIGVFLCIYLGLGILFEYVMKIPMGFYNVPIVVAFLAAILVACLQNREVSFDRKLEIMAHGVGDKNIITMLLIFLTAGSFVGVVGRSSAESVAYFMLTLIPARFSVAVLFVVACFVSVAIARALAMEPEILLFDEPTSALDPQMVGEVLEVMRTLAKDGLTMFIVTHEMAFARDVAKHVIFMGDGVIVEEGTSQQIFEDPQKEATREFLSRFRTAGNCPGARQ